MRSILAVLVVSLLLSLSSVAQTSPAPAPKLDIPNNMKQYFVGILVQGPKFDPHMSQEEHQQLIQKHLAYIRSQVEAGTYMLVGPATDEGRMLGMAIIKVKSIDEARRILEGDPGVQSGRFGFEVHPVMLADLSCVHMEYPK